MSLMSVLFLVLAISFNIARGHNHSIIFLVDESAQISEQNCRKQQNGISDYFQWFYDLKAENLLSYITFNQLGEINKIIDFNDEFHIPFDNLINKIQSIDCYNNYTYKNITHRVQNDFSKINLALSSAITTYNRSDMKTPRILLFTRFEAKTLPENFTNYNYDIISSIFDCKNILGDYNHYYFADFKIKIVNIDSMPSDNDFISDYYSTCLPFSNIRVYSLKNVEYNTFLVNKEKIGYAICIGPCWTGFPCPTTTPTNNPTKTPTNNPAKTTINPTKTPTNNPTKTTNNPTKTPTNNPTKTTNNPTKTPTNNPTKTPTNNPTKTPTNNPSKTPTNNPSKTQTNNPTKTPINNPINNPSTSSDSSSSSSSSPDSSNDDIYNM